MFDRLALYGIVAGLMFGTAAAASPMGDAVAAYNRGDYADAVAQLKIMAIGGDAKAKFNLGYMAEKGYIKNCDIGCAIDWYKQSATGGVIFGYTMAGILEFNAGLTSEGMDDLTTAARYNEQQARSLLSQMNKIVPEPDYYNEAQELRAEEEQKQRDYALSQEEARRQQAALAQQRAQAAASDEALIGLLLGVNLARSFAPAKPTAPSSVKLKANCTAVGKIVNCN